MSNKQESTELGGPGKIVQIDESKFGRRKYNRGRQVEGHWVVGMIEDGRQDVVFRVVETRDKEVLHPFIQEHVLPGTTIHTDGWRGYYGLGELGYVHKQVKHSENFVGKYKNYLCSSINTLNITADDGTHTQRIESTWRPAKDWFRRRRVPSEQFADHLMEYLWRRLCRKSGRDPLEMLLDAVRAQYKDYRL